MVRNFKGNAADRAKTGSSTTQPLTFVYLACAIFVAAAVRLFRAPPGASGLASFYPEILLCAIAVFAGLVGSACSGPWGSPPFLPDR